MFDTGERPTALLQRVCSAARAEACAAAARLEAIGELFGLRVGQSEETADWAIDAEAAVCAEVAAALSISQGLAASHLRYARAMREVLPALGQVKTFWGWRDEQLRDGTLLWASPAGDKYVTSPGSALLFPHLMVPTGPLPATMAPRTEQRCGERTAMMPRRSRTRAQDRAAAITAERRHNHHLRTTAPTPETRHDEDLDYEDTLPRAPDPPPPF